MGRISASINKDFIKKHDKNSYIGYFIEVDIDNPN